MLDDAPNGARSPGWHPHPEHETVERYWDGARWTGAHRFETVAARSAADRDNARPGPGDALEGIIAWLADMGPEGGLRTWLTEETFVRDGPPRARGLRRACVGLVLAFALVGMLGTQRTLVEALATVLAPSLIGLACRGRWVLVAGGAYGLAFGALIGLLVTAVSNWDFFSSTDIPPGQAAILMSFGAVIGAATTAVLALGGQWLGSWLDS